MKKITLTFIIIIISNIVFSQNIYKLIENNDYEKIKKYSKPLNIYNKDKTTPLMWAIYKSDLKMVKLLVKKGANPKQKSFHRNNSWLCGSNFVMAAWTGKIEILDYLLRKKHFKIDEAEYGYKNNDIRIGWNALHTAVYNNQIEIIKYLIKNNADINAAAETSENKTPLLLALYNDNIEVTKLLIELGADVNKRDANYNSALDFTLDNSSKKTRKMVKLIYQKGFKFTENRKQEYLLQLKKYFNINSFEEL